MDRLISLGLMFNRAAVAEVIEALGSFEVDMVRMAAERHDEHDRARLTELMAAIRETSVRPRELSPYDLEFHMALADASHNGVMVHLIRWMRALAEIWMEVWEDNELDRGPAICQIIREHEEILDGVRARDPERAAAAIHAHLTDAGERVLAVPGRDRSSAEYIAHLLAHSP